MRPTIDKMLRHERPELWEQWTQTGELSAQIERLVMIATDLSEQANDPSSTNHQLSPSSRSQHLVPIDARWCLKAVWLATEDDWHAATMALEDGDEISLPPSPPSNWYTPSL